MSLTLGQALVLKNARENLSHSFDCGTAHHTYAVRCKDYMFFGRIDAILLLRFSSGVYFGRKYTTVADVP